MYIYIDESGNFGWPLKAGSEPYMLFSVLVIDDLKSKRAISQAVSRAIADLRKHHPSCKSDPNKRIMELKGSGELADRPDVRLRFFKRIVKKANFHIYAVILDKRLLKQPLPSNYMERYSMLLLNILYAIPIPKNQKWVTMVVDSQATAEPTRPLKVRYPSKAKRLHQKRARAQDRSRRNQYTQMITSVFKRFLKPSGTHLKVWHIRSHDDRCLQAVDVIGHFLYQGLKIKRLKEEREALFQSLLPRERSREQLEKNKQWQKIKRERTIWFEAHEVLKPKIEFVRQPPHLVRQGIRKLAKYARQFRKTREQGQP
jgi:FtsZ-binding cell division protein ZapB